MPSHPCFLVDALSGYLCDFLYCTMCFPCTAPCKFVSFSSWNMLHYLKNAPSHLQPSPILPSSSFIKDRIVSPLMPPLHQVLLDFVKLCPLYGVSDLDNKSETCVQSAALNAA
jgi:hypothetical protein